MSALGQKRTHAVQQEDRYSINSLARASTAGGIARPSALAVLRLITNSYFAGARVGAASPMQANFVGAPIEKQINE
jgi:hypothetical protein